MRMTHADAIASCAWALTLDCGQLMNDDVLFTSIRK